MLHAFLSKNRDQLIRRCREKVEKRSAPRPTERELRYGIALFLNQLIDSLRVAESRISFSPSEGELTPRHSEIARAAAQHGNELLRKGFTVDQVVHDYVDLCQAVTEMAIEQDTDITLDEFRMLNQCLDDAIADAVTEFVRQRDQFVSDESIRTTNERLGFFAHELRNLLHTAMLALTAIRKGDVGVSGATGSLLDRSLIGLRDLVDRALVEVRLTAGIPERRERIVVAQLIAEIQIAAGLDAATRGAELIVSPVDEALAIDADRQILAGAVANLLQNALKFSRLHGRVSLTAHAEAGRMFIEVEDECGGLPVGAAEALFRPFEQLNGERTGLGLGLAISRRGVEANGGKLTVRNIPERGCVFSIDIPLAALPL